MGSADDVPPKGRTTNRGRPATGPGKSVKAMVSLFEGPSPSASVKGDEVRRTSAESLSSAPHAESSIGQHSGKKKGKALAAASDGAANQQLSMLLEQLDRFGVEEDGRASNPAAPPQQQEVEPEQTERRDPKEVKQFWGNVRAQLWIDDDELDDPPALDEEEEETSKLISEGTAVPFSSTVAWRGSKTPRKFTEPLAPPDTSLSPDSPFGTEPVLKSLKEYYEKKENEPAQSDSPRTAVPLQGGMTFGNRFVDPSLVPRPLRTPSRGGFATSPTLPSTTSGDSFALSSPTLAAHSRTRPVQGQLGSSPPTVSTTVIDDILTQFPAVPRQYPPPAQQMGSSPPTRASSIGYRSEDEQSVYSQDEQQFGSSPPPPPIPARSPLRPRPEDLLPPATRDNRHGTQHASSSHLSIDQYYYLFKEPEGQGDTSSQMPSRLPSNNHPVLGTQDRRSAAESIPVRRRHTRFPRIDTSLANTSNTRARAYDHEKKPSNPFDLLEVDEEGSGLDTPMLPRMPQHQTHGSGSTNASAGSSNDSDRSSENRVTRWPTVAPLGLSSRNASSTSLNSASRSSSTATLAPALPVNRQAALPSSSTTGGHLGASPRSSIAAQRRSRHRRQGMTMNMTTPQPSSGPSAAADRSDTIAAASGSGRSGDRKSTTPSTPYGAPPFPAPAYPPPSIPPHARGGSGDSTESGTKTPQEKIVELDEFFANLDVGAISSKLSKLRE